MKNAALAIKTLGFCCFAAVLACSAQTGHSAQNTNDKPNVRAVSLMVIREPDGPAIDALLDSPAGEFRAGVMLVGRIQLPAGNIVSVDKALKVDKFGDDKGTDFGKGEVKSRFGRDDGMQCYMSSDHKQCTFWLASTTLPAPGADKLVLEGTLNLQMGSGEKSAESTKLPLKLGQEFVVGDTTLKVTRISADIRVEGAGFQVVFASTGLGKIKSIACTDGDGKTVAAQFEEGTRGGLATITLARPVTEMTLRLVQYEKIETVTLPVKLEVKVGL